MFFFKLYTFFSILKQGEGKEDVRGNWGPPKIYFDNSLLSVQLKSESLAFLF